MEPYKTIGGCIPDGMKVMTVSNFFQNLTDVIVGYESFFLMIYDDLDLLKKIFKAWGDIVYEFYDKVLDYDFVGGLFHADDLGSKHATMVSREFLKEVYYPWLRKFIELAHSKGKTFWMHCCGNIYREQDGERVIDDFIHLGIDAFHSFQDVILPVGTFMKNYGDRTGVLGGLDVDAMIRLPEEELRSYIRSVLNEGKVCGRYACGTGNSVPDYMSLERYGIMLEEARSFIV
jgi:uroporphyrinogen decarboxylase